MESIDRRVRVLLVDEFGPRAGADGNPVPQEGPFEIDHLACDQNVLRQLVEHHPDVVLVDWRIAENHGLRVIRDVRRIDGRVPIIVMTGEARKSLVAAALAAGATCCLAKPLTVQALSAKLVEWSRGPAIRSRQNLRATSRRRAPRATAAVSRGSLG